MQTATMSASGKYTLIFAIAVLILSNGPSTSLVPSTIGGGAGFSAEAGSPDEVEGASTIGPAASVLKTDPPGLYARAPLLHYSTGRP